MTVERPRLVLHVIDSLGRSGGAEQQLTANLRRMDDRRLVHQVLCLYDPQTGSRADELPPGVAVTALFPAGHRTRNRLKLIVAMRAAFGSIRPDLVHCALPDAALASRMAGRALGIPVIESLVNVSHESFRTIDNPAVTPAKLAAHRLLDRLTMGSVQQFHALSRAVACSWIETVGLQPDKVVVVPRGVDPADLVDPINRQSVRRRVLAEIGIPESAFVVINVGRQVAQKGQIYALRALPAVLAGEPEAVFVSVGSEGAMTSRLRMETARLGLGDRVRWLGVRSDVAELLAAGDVFVFPSLYEGLGVSLLQAMATALPSVTTAAPPMSDVVTDGVTGLLVPDRDPVALADAILRLARDHALRHRLGAEARRHVLKDFDLSDTSRRLEIMYLRALESADL